MSAELREADVGEIRPRYDRGNRVRTRTGDFGDVAAIKQEGATWFYRLHGVAAVDKAWFHEDWLILAKDHRRL